LFLILLFAIFSNAKTYYVVVGGAGNKDGSSWNNAYANIQNAIDAASNDGGGEVCIQNGTYYNSLTMKPNVKIYGGFNGNEKSKDARSVFSYDVYKKTPSQISQYATVIHGGNYRRVINISNVGSSVVLDNLIIKSGFHSQLGAGINNVSSSPVITNCVFIENKISNSVNTVNNSESLRAYGAAIANDNASSPTIENCYFEANEINITLSGRTVYNGYADVNVATLNLSASGGAIHSASSITIKGCTFKYNAINATLKNAYRGSYSVVGGGVSLPANSTIENCVFIKNDLHWLVASYNDVDITVNGIDFKVGAYSQIINTSIDINAGLGEIDSKNRIYSIKSDFINCSFNLRTDFNFINMPASENRNFFSNCIFSAAEPTATGNPIYLLLHSGCVFNFSGFTTFNYGACYGHLKVDDDSYVVCRSPVSNLTPKYDARGVLRPTDKCTPGVYEPNPNSPKITTQPSNTESYQGVKFTLSLVATSPIGSSMEYQWVYAGTLEPLPKVTGQTQSEGKLTYIFNDPGIYSILCIVKVANNNITKSNVIKVKVYGPVTEAKLNSSYKYLRATDEFDLNVISDAYLPTYQWQE